MTKYYRVFQNIDVRILMSLLLEEVPSEDLPEPMEEDTVEGLSPSVDEVPLDGLPLRNLEEGTLEGLQQPPEGETLEELPQLLEEESLKGTPQLLEKDLKVLLLDEVPLEELPKMLEKVTLEGLPPPFDVVPIERMP